MQQNDSLKKKCDEQKRRLRAGVRNSRFRRVEDMPSPTMYPDQVLSPEPRQENFDLEALPRLNTTGSSVSGRYDADRVRELEKQVSELTVQCETYMKDAEFASKASTRRIKKLENDLATTRKELERATDRNSELEQELKEKKDTLLQVSPDIRAVGLLRKQGARSPFKQFKEDEEEFQMIKKRFSELETAHAALQASKKILNERLQNFQTELKGSKQRCLELESRVRSLAHFEQDFEKQTTRVNQLEAALEEQRRYMTGDYTPVFSPIKSPEMSPELIRKHETRIQEEYDRGKSLMAELEMVLFKASEGHASGVDTIIQTFSAKPYEPTNESFLEQFIGIKSPFMEGESMASAATSALIGRDEDKSFFGLLTSVIHGFARWFKFMMLLWAAVMVTVYRGPKQRITQNPHQEKKD